MDKNTAIATMDFGATTGDINVLSDYKPILDKNIHFEIDPSNLDDIVGNIIEGFKQAIDAASSQGFEVKATSFAFPGPADFPNGIIGPLNNAPAFQEAGQYNLGKKLTDELGIPTFVNNDGDLYADGERQFGRVQDIKRNPNLKWNVTGCIGLTLGSGLGCGKSTDSQGMFIGESGTGLEFGVNPIIVDGEEIRLEKLVSRRGVVILYNQNLMFNKAQWGIDNENSEGPKIIEAYAKGKKGEAPQQQAAKNAYNQFGRYLGLGMVWASNMGDTPVIVLGGGLSNAYDLFIPSAMDYMKGRISGERHIKRLMKTAYNLEDPQELSDFMESGDVFGNKKVGICRTRIGAAAAIQAGAYGYAMDQLKKTR